MENYFLKVKNYLLDLGMVIISENESNGTIIVKDEDRGIANLIVAIVPPIVIFEQKLLELKNYDERILIKFLKKNRDIIHGAIAMADDNKTIIFRDTLQVENLDRNEVEGTINSLELFLAEFLDDLIELSK